MTQEIRRLFNSRLQSVAATSFLAEVKKVDKDTCTCSVAMNGLNFDDVLIRSVSDGNSKGVILLPKVGSMVMATRIGGSNELYLSMFSEVDEVAVAVGDKTSLTVNEAGVVCKVGTTSLEVAEDGISLAKESYNLKDALETIINTILEIQVDPSSGKIISILPADIPTLKAKLNFLK